MEYKNNKKNRHLGLLGTLLTLSCWKSILVYISYVDINVCVNKYCDSLLLQAPISSAKNQYKMIYNMN